MYNPQLDTFQVVAEAGSFAKASQRLFVSSSAVLQQINSLESSLKVRLFDRSSRGLRLTPAGEYLLGEMPRLTAWNEAVRRKLILLSEDSREVLRIALPKMHKCRFFYELWKNYSVLHPEQKIQFLEAPDSAGKSVAETYAQADIVEFIQFEADWQRGLSFLPLCSMPVVLLVPAHHRLASASMLSPEDLAGETVTVNDGAFRARLEKPLRTLSAAGARIRGVPFYSSAVLAQCIVEDSLLAVPLCSANIHPSLKAVPCSWNASFPYGFFYSPRAADGPGSFIEYVRDRLRDGARYDYSVY